MSTPKDGGPAFPVSPEIYSGTGLCGMTLRDWFAGQALQGLLACPSLQPNPESMDKYLSEWAFKYADAMLAEREKGQQ